jgi:hypothetical protein
MLPIIIIVLIGTVVALGLYSLLLKKYYWGPKGPPKKNERNKKGR